MVFIFINLEITQMAVHLQALISILTDVHTEHQRMLKDLDMLEI